MISRETEEKYLLVPLVKHLEVQLTTAKASIDMGDPYSRDVEWFEVFFALDPNAGDTIDPDNIDGWQSLAALVREAVCLVAERYGERYQMPTSQGVAVGICATTEWYWEDEVPEIEAMIGDIRDSDGLVGCWRFAVRFSTRPERIEGRCLAAPLPLLPQTSTEDHLEGNPQHWSIDEPFKSSE